MSSTVPNIQNNSPSNQKSQIEVSLDKCQKNIKKTIKQNQAKEYQQYTHKKKTQFNNSKSQNQSSLPDNKKICIIVFAVAMIIVFVTAIIYTAKYRSIQQVDQINNKQKKFLLKPPDHFYTRHYHDTATSAAAITPSTVSAPSQKCNQQLPYNVLNERETRLNYPLWFGKANQYIYGRKYQSGHFIQRHVAVGGKCTTDQNIEGKTVFYDWNQVNKAFMRASLNKCPLLDRTRFSYQFQNKISNPNQYIKGIDCRSGSVRNFSKFFILYRKASRNPNQYHQQYINSNQVTIWTFYPKF